MRRRDALRAILLSPLFGLAVVRPSPPKYRLFVFDETPNRDASRGANVVFSSPTSGLQDAPHFRPLMAMDLPGWKTGDPNYHVGA